MSHLIAKNPSLNDIFLVIGISNSVLVHRSSNLRKIFPQSIAFAINVVEDGFKKEMLVANLNLIGNLRAHN